MRKAWAAVALLPVLLPACSGDAAGPGRGNAASMVERHHPASDQDAPGRTADPAVAGDTSRGAKRVDPRRGGLRIGLAEWAVTPEASAIRPGPVTLVIDNRGTRAHGFEIELEGDSSGSGSGSLFKTESRLLEPGVTTRLKLNLRPGTYKIECLVDGHDDMGMEAALEVRADAPFQSRPERRPPGEIVIADLSFSPGVARVESGTKVTWINADPTAHTVTAVDGAFGSDTLNPGDTFSFRATDPGVFRYRCAIHPEMKAVLRVE